MKSKILSKTIYCLVMILILFAVEVVPSYALGRTVLDVTKGYRSSVNQPASPNQYYEPTETRNLATSGAYEFSGYAERTGLYTNYYFTGKTSYSVEVTNNSAKKTLKVIAYKINEKGKKVKLKTVTVKPNVISQFKISDLNSSDSILLYFSAPCDFEGYIK